MNLLLHACCGPCSLEPVRLLQEAGHSITICFANSNIAPREEYDKRLDTLRKWALEQGIPVVDLPYNNAAWQEAIREKPLGPLGTVLFGSEYDDPLITVEQEPKRTVPNGTLEPKRTVPDGTPNGTYSGHEARCRACYAMRLEEAAAWGEKHGFEALSTTLAVSPYQLSEVCREELEAAAVRHGLACVWEDFRPYYPQATRRSREAGMYRQNYCGCTYSKAEAEAERAAHKAEKAAAQAIREAELEAARAERAAKQAAFDKKQRRKREIRNSFRH